MGDFDGQCVLVTGGSRGIGRAVCEEFGRRGAVVAVHYATNEAAARQVVEGLAGGGHVAIPADLGAGGARGLIESTIERLGRIDVLVNNAGIYEAHPVLTTSPDDWDASWARTIATNLIGPADLIHAAVPHMVEQGGGRIVNVTSRGAFRGEPAHAAPGFVETDMAAAYLNGPGGDAVKAQSPMGRAASPAEIARVVVFLASPGSESATGSIVDVNGASYLRS